MSKSTNTFQQSSCPKLSNKKLLYSASKSIHLTPKYGNTKSLETTPLNSLMSFIHSSIRKISSNTLQAKLLLMISKSTKSKLPKISKVSPCQPFSTPAVLHKPRFSCLNQGVQTILTLIPLKPQNRNLHLKRYTTVQ